MEKPELKRVGRHIAPRKDLLANFKGGFQAGQLNRAPALKQTEPVVQFGSGRAFGKDSNGSLRKFQ